IAISYEDRHAEGPHSPERVTGGSVYVPAATLTYAVRWGQANADSEYTSVFYNMALPFGETELYSFGGYSNRTALGNCFYSYFYQAAKTVV
ncbi:ligand-gated channel protein, partial [Pseudoalteromonas sp. S1649]